MNKNSTTIDEKSNTKGFSKRQDFFSWGNLPLSRKLLSAFGALFVLALIIAVVSLWGLNRVQSKYEDSLATGIKTQDISQELKIAFAAARQAEADFLINRESLGYDRAYEEYVPKNHQHIARVKGLIEELTDLGNTLKEDQADGFSERHFDSNLSFLASFVDIYEKDFAQAVELIEKSEGQDSGLEVNLQVARNAIDEWFHKQPGLEELNITWLRLQTVEKDFLLGGRHENITRVNEISAQFRAEIETSEELELSEKNALTNLIEEYITAFRNVVENRQTLWYINAAFTLSGERIDRYVEEFWLLGVEMTDTNVVQARLNSNQTFLLLAIILVVLLIAFFVLANIFSRQITQPIIQLTNFTRQVEMGHLELQATVSSGDEIGELASSFNKMTNQLRDLIGTLEQRVATRTRALETSTEVSRRLATIFNPEELVREVVEQAQSAFGYYHAHIYLVEEDELVMAGGTGDAGAEMLASGHSISVGRGLVGRAAETNQAVLVSDTSQDPDWLPNPLLPDTKSEVAIPISTGDQVLGVLDVQHDVAGGMSQEDVDSLQSIANQVAVALQNARIFTQAEQQRNQNELILGSAAEGIFGLDLQGNHTFVNPAAAEMLGYSSEELIGEHSHSMWHHTHADGTPFPGEECPIYFTLRDGKANQGEEYFLRKDGSGIDVSFSSTPIHEEGHLVGAVVSFADITQQKHERETIAQNARHQEALNLITQKIQSAATIEEAMQVTARELGHALGKRQTFVTLDPASLSDNGKEVISE